MTEEEQSESVKEPDGKRTTTNEDTEESQFRKSSAGLKLIESTNSDVSLFYIWSSCNLFGLSGDKEAESSPVCDGQSGTAQFNHSNKDSGPDQVNGLTKAPPSLRDLETELLQSGKLKLTGKFASDLHSYFTFVYI